MRATSLVCFKSPRIFRIMKFISDEEVMKCKINFRVELLGKNRPVRPWQGCFEKN